MWPFVQAKLSRIKECGRKSATQSPLATGGESNWIERGRAVYRGFFQFGGSYDRENSGVIRTRKSAWFLGAAARTLVKRSRGKGDLLSRLEECIQRGPKAGPDWRLTCKHVYPSHESPEEQILRVQNDPTGGEDARDSSACRWH